MHTDPIDRFLADRATWKAAGRPACVAFRHWLNVERQEGTRHPVAMPTRRPTPAEVLANLQADGLLVVL